MKKMKKLLAGFMAATMVMSMSVTAFADEVKFEDMSTITLTKTYEETNDGTISPEETFEFSTLTCTEVTNGGVLSDGTVVNTTTAPVPTIGTVNYSSGEAGSATATKDITITLPEYQAVGIYTYTFTENDGNTAGVTYRSDEIRLVVTVIEQGEQIRVAALHTEGENGTKSNAIDNVYSAGSLSVNKQVTGLLGDKQKEFTVVVTFTAPSGDTVREAISYTDGTDTKTIDAGWNTTAEATITLKHGETVTFTNIPYGVTYTVAESDYTSEGYTASYDNDADDDITEDDELNINDASDKVVITNNKGGTVDTGISLDNMPYIMVLAMVALGLVGFVSKKRSMEF